MTPETERFLTLLQERINNYKESISYMSAQRFQGTNSDEIWKANGVLDELEDIQALIQSWDRQEKRD